MKKIFVSSCLAGLPVRYNARDKQTNTAIMVAWRAEGRLVHLCPEVAAGFLTPRPPAEIIGGVGEGVFEGVADVFEDSGRQVTGLYIVGAQRALALAREHGVAAALLTDGSPSCGSSFVYDGSFSGRTKAGTGVTAALFERHGIKVFPDSQIAEADCYLRSIGE